MQFEEARLRGICDRFEIGRRSLGGRKNRKTRGRREGINPIVE